MVLPQTQSRQAYSSSWLRPPNYSAGSCWGVSATNLSHTLASTCLAVVLQGRSCERPKLVVVQDLATAFVKVLANETAYGQIYNISGEKYVTFDGIARACAKVMLPELAADTLPPKN